MSPQTATTITGPFEPQYVMIPIREKNGLGVAGFLIALLGLFIPTGIIALLGLLISLAALGRAPRGLATLGVIMGLFGTVFWLAVMIVAGVSAIAVGGIVLAALTAGFVLLNTEMIEVTADMANVSLVLVDRQERDGTLPETLEPLGLSVSTLTDPWGKPYRFQIVDDDELGFDLTSGGRDATFGTEDDIALSQIDAAWEDAFDGFEGKMEDLGQRFERLQKRSSRQGGPAWLKGYDARARREVAATRSATVTAHSDAPEPEAVVQPPVATAAPPAPEPPATGSSAP